MGFLDNTTSAFSHKICMAIYTTIKSICKQWIESLEKDATVPHLSWIEIWVWFSDGCKGHLLPCQNVRSDSSQMWEHPDSSTLCSMVLESIWQSQGQDWLVMQVIMSSVWILHSKIYFLLIHANIGVLLEEWDWIWIVFLGFLYFRHLQALWIFDLVKLWCSN